MRESIEKVLFWALAAVLVGFLASGVYFLLRRAIVGRFISG